MSPYFVPDPSNKTNRISAATTALLGATRALIQARVERRKRVAEMREQVRAPRLTLDEQWHERLGEIRRELAVVGDHDLANHVLEAIDDRSAIGVAVIADQLEAFRDHGSEWTPRGERVLSLARDALGLVVLLRGARNR